MEDKVIDKNEHLVSIITPAYNCEKYISECIESVLDQTYTNWEMIIVNDKSKDNTLAVAQEYSARDNRIIIVDLKENSGVSTARNKALEIAKGRFIAFLDSDDMWKKNKLEEQIQFMLKNKYGFTFTSYELMKEGRPPKLIHVPTKINYNQYLKNTIIGCLTVVMDRQIIGDIKIEIGCLEDTLTWMKYLKQGYIAYGLDENLARYRVLKQSLSSNKIINAKRYFLCLRKVQKLPLIKCVYCQLGYMYNATKKRIF